MPPIGEAAFHACSLGDKVYVIGYYRSRRRNAIYVLDNPGASISSQDLLRWQEIVAVLPDGLSPPRTQVGFAPLNSTEIAIIGGVTVNTEWKSLGDMFTFNTVSKEFKREV